MYSDHGIDALHDGKVKTVVFGLLRQILSGADAMIFTALVDLISAQRKFRVKIQQQVFQC